MGKVMMSMTAPQGAPTVDEIERRFALPRGAIDRQFGVVEIDDLTHEYAISVEENAVPRIKSTTDLTFVGPFSNPRIETFGPPE